MTEAQAIKEAETKYASLEDFCLTVFAHEKRDLLLSPKTSWQKKANVLGISTKATTVLLSLSKRYQRTMKELSLSQHWNFDAQEQANAQFVQDTANPAERPSERVKVAQYLNRESGIGVDEDTRQGGLVVNLTFSGLTMTELLGRTGGLGARETGDGETGEQAEEQKTITLDPQGRALPPYRSNSSGDPSPLGVRLLEAGAAQRINSADALLPEKITGLAARPGESFSPSEARKVAESATPPKDPRGSERSQNLGALADKLFD